MPHYRYTAKNLQSNLIRGEQEAENEVQLASVLRETGLFLTRCSETSAVSAAPVRPKANELAGFASELGTMLASGISLVKAMSILLQSDRNPRLQALYQTVHQRLQKGDSFSEALAAQQGAFPPLMINLFRSGEVSGRMDQAARKVAAHYEKDYKIRSKIKNAMIYPVILIVVAVLAIVGIFTFILPSFFDTFSQLDVELPGITKAVMSFSSLLTQHWLICLLTVIGVLLVLVFLLQLPAVQIQLDRLKLKLPKIGGLMRSIYTARFARTLSSLYTSGLSILDALAVSAETIGNRYLAGQFERVSARLRNGAPLSQALQEVKGFSPKLVSVTVIGEESGRLDEVLDQMADSFDFESEKAIDRLIAMLEPAMIVLLALGIGAIMISVLLPLYTMYQNIG